jgi:hypothetical protein
MRCLGYGALPSIKIATLVFLERLPKMDFETLDTVADSYIPLLAIVFWVGVAYQAFRHPGKKRFLARVFCFFIGLLMVSYGMLFIDNAWQLWPAFHLDYSTHTAVSLTLVLSLCALARQGWILVVASFLLYLLLMWYQKYHTVGDMVSTIIVIGLSACALATLLFSKAKVKAKAPIQPRCQDNHSERQK